MRYLTQIIFVTLLALFFSGCEAAKSLTTPKSEVIDKTLPIPQEIKILTDINSVAFEWKPTLDPNVEGYYIYRGQVNTDDGTPSRIAKIDSRYVSHYVDDRLKSGVEYMYQFATYNKKNEPSDRSEIIYAKTNIVEPVTFVNAISNYPRQVKVIWRPHSSQKIKYYIVERNDATSTKWENIGRVENRLMAEYLDTGLEDNRIYRYRVKAVTFDGIESAPSDISEATTKELPPTITGLKATTDLPKKIKLTWDSVFVKDFIHFKIYRSFLQIGPYLNIGTADGVVFEDEVKDDGKVYFYKVVAVDKDLLESPRQDNGVMGSTLGKPKKPYIKSAFIEGTTVVLSWEAGDDRAIEYTLYKSTGGFFEKPTIIEGIKENSFTDNDVLPGQKYLYWISAKDINGIHSDSTEKIELLLSK